MSNHSDHLVQNFVLVLNAGSSSLKFALFNESSTLVRTFAGVIDRIDLAPPQPTLPEYIPVSVLSIVAYWSDSGSRETVARELAAPIKSRRRSSV